MQKKYIKVYVSKVEVFLSLPTSALSPLARYHSRANALPPLMRYHSRADALPPLARYHSRANASQLPKVA